MTHTEDLIHRLRDTASRGVSSWGDLQQEAADELETLMKAVAAEREACAKVCEKHAEVYAGLEQNSTTQSAWAACIDSRDAIRARGNT